MGSLGEEELDQMVRDYIESADSPSSFSVASSNRSKYLALQEVLGKHTDGEVEIHEKISMYVKHMGSIGVGEIRNQTKWVVMSLTVDGFEASLCRTTWDSACSFSKGSYEYVEVVVDKNNSGRPTRLIVDLDFRSQFEVARPTKSYKELVSALPSIFVGIEEKLSEIIALLCSAGKKSLKENGLHIPPWRSANYMRAKWLSENCKKVPFSSLVTDQNEEKTNSSCCPLISYLAKGHHQASFEKR